MKKRYALLTQFHQDVEKETIRARALFTPPGAHLERDDISRPLWGTIIVEEIGKLCRCFNKLSIVEDEEVKEKWLDEAYFRIITSSSLLRRLAENLERLPRK